MELQFKKLEAADIRMLRPFYERRPNKTCDSVIIDSFIWREYFQVRYAISEGGQSGCGGAVQWLMEENGILHSAMPICAEGELEHYFYEMVDYFNRVLNRPFKIYLADAEAVEYLQLKESPDFDVVEQADLKDYLYDGDALRTLSGKKLLKKRNHVNSFKKTYDGRYEYRRLDSGDRGRMLDCLERWRMNKGEDVEAHLDPEVWGVRELVDHCEELDVRMAGILVDGVLEAFTMGSYNAREDMAIIHVEKANPDIRGLYQFINQMFLQQEFPDVRLVNREDDLGQPGLRTAKLSYNPIGYAGKYLIMQKNFTPGQEGS